MAIRKVKVLKRKQGVAMNYETAEESRSYLKPSLQTFSTDEMFESLKQHNLKLQEKINVLNKKMVVLLRNQNKLDGTLSKQLNEQNKILERLTISNQNIEESLMNVILAIRQNEYLQAWYPEQKGHPGVKVTGLHPYSISRKQSFDK